jgi:hypothetical protein
VSLFNDPIEHAENPPESWKIEKVGARWHLQSQFGATMDTFERKRDALAARVDGPLVRLYADETRWYAGESVRGWRAYTECVAGR